jgi:hypothetical protein
MEHFLVNQELFLVDQGIEKNFFFEINKFYFFFSELKARAKRWDEKHLDALRHRKDKLFDEYKEQQKKKRREAELINARLEEN